MKGISSSSSSSSSSLVFALRCGGGGGVYGCCSSRSSSSYRIVAKKSSNKRQSTSPKGSQPPPPRITTNVKQNLQVLKLWKEFRKRKGVAKPATSYRKKKVEKEDLPEESESYQDPNLTLNSTHQEIETALPVMLVDGYNVCGYWVKLKTHFLGGRLDIARQTLIEELIAFSTIQEVKVVVVFDALMSGLPTHKETFYGIDIVFSGETCADSWIEKEVAALKEDGCPTVWVVTSDRCQQDVAHGTGAYIWSCKTLISEIEASHREVKRMQQEHRCHSVQGKLLKHNLDSKVVDALKDLRNKLYQIELSSKDQKKKKKISYTADHVSLSPSVQGKLSKNNLDSEVAVAVKDLGNKLPQNEPCSKDQKRKEKMSHAADNVSSSPSVNGKSSKLNLDSKVVDALKDLRNKLAQNELHS